MLFESLIGQAFCARGDVDDAAILEPVPAQVVLHDLVIFMCIDPDIVRDAVQVIHHGPKYAVYVRQFGNAMDDIIRLFVVQPGAAFDDGIGGIRGRDAGEVGHDTPILHHHLSIPRADVPPHHLFGGVTLGPLVGISRCEHDVTPRFQHLHDGGKVRKRCVFQLKHKYKYTKIG